ncbi:MAG: 4Fe-4S binding protein [Kiritimatiellia bacterium]
METRVSEARFKIIIDRETCKGCELCVCACPNDVLRMSGEFNTSGRHFAAVADCGKCVGCLNCTLMCPDAAIEIHTDKPSSGEEA